MSRERHVYSGSGFRTLCGLSYGEGPLQGLPGDDSLPTCERCAVRDAAARLGGFKWVVCTNCSGTGSEARTDSASTTCFRCMEAGLYPSHTEAVCYDCGHRESVHAPNVGCRVGSCQCVQFAASHDP